MRIFTPMPFLMAFCLALFPPIVRADNPIIKDRFTADPAALVFRDRVYLYTGHDEAPANGKGFTMKNWRCYSSGDMINWKDEGSPMSVQTFGWAARDAWAGQVIERGGKFYWYATLSHRTVPGFSIGVGVSDSPTGPFTDARGTALITNDMTKFTGISWDDIDPTVWIDNDGQAYLFWGNTKCHYAKLKANMTELDGPIVNIELPKFTEAPYIHRRGALYYLSYAYGFPEQIAYATASQVTGPYTFRGVLNDVIPNSPTNHQAIIDFKGKSYFFYHNAALPGGGEFHRSVCVEELFYNPDGTIKPISQSKSGVLDAATLAPATLAPVTAVIAPPVKEVPMEAPPMEALPAAVLPGVHADPHLAVFGDTFYLYPTTDGSEGWMSSSFSAWSSRDLKSWRDEGVILDLPRDLTWAKARAWAPAIARKGGKYFYYFSADANIGVAVSDRPTGPFIDALGKPLVAKGAFRGQMIDPMVFVDDDGSAYLYFGQGQCNIVPLGDDMISFDAGQVRQIRPPGYNEGSFVFKRQGIYYLSWSEFDTRDPRYSVAYATSNSPLGPFTKAPSNPILQQKGAVKGAGHHSIMQITGRDEWVIAYHRFRVPGGNGYNRETCLSPLHFDAHGAILPVDVYESVKAVPLQPSLKR